MIASHYADPLERRIAAPTPLHVEPSRDAPVIRELEPGEVFALLDDTVGWAWGYAGTDKRVGYLTSEALAA